MPKGSTPKGGSSGNASWKKWIPKGEKDDETEQPTSPKASEEVITSPLLLEPSTGPLYKRVDLLRFFEVYNAVERPFAKSRCDSMESNAEEKLRDRAASVTLEERPKEEGSEKLPGERRAHREQKKAARKGSDMSEGEPGSPSNAQKIALTQELPSGAWLGGHNMMTADAMVMAYLTSMYAGASPAGAYTSGYTTVMLRNIPNRYTREKLVEIMNQDYEGKYDFVYLPIDFNSKCNVGYAFINFRQPADSVQFIKDFHGQKTKLVLPGFGSTKVCEVSYARVQGSEANMDNLRDDKFIEKLNERPEWQPLFFDSDGKEIPFAQTLGKGKRRAKADSGTPKHAAPQSVPVMPPPNYMMPQMMYPPYGYPMMPPPYGAAPAAAEALQDKKKKKKRDKATESDTTPNVIDSRAFEQKLGATAEGAKGKGQKAKGQSKGMQMPPGGYPGYPYGYPGYPGGYPPGYPGRPPLGYPAVHPAYAAYGQAMAMAQAHAAARHQAAAHAGLLDPSATQLAKPLDEEGRAKLRKQIEFYFSVDNLCKDLYLRSFMNSDGWTPLAVIVQFPRVGKKLGADVPACIEALSKSEVLEVDAANHQIRLKNEEQRMKWARVTEGEAAAKAADAPASATS